MNNTEEIRVVMADDHEIFRDGFRLTLSRAAGITLVAEASDGIELVKQVTEHQPHVVITDIKMPNMDGIAAARQISARWPSVGIIGLSMFDEEELIVEMLEAGASGYLLKNADKAEVIEAIKAVHRKESFYCRHTSNRLAMMIGQKRHGSQSNSSKPKVELTEKEAEVLQLVCNEFTNKDIADRLYLSVRTVEGLRIKIMEKMDVSNSVGMVVFAMQHGLFNPNTDKL